MTAIRGSSFFTERLLPFNATAEGAELYSKYHNTAESSFPDYLEEIRGMATGAQLTYSEVRLASSPGPLSYAERPGLAWPFFPRKKGGLGTRLR